MKSNKNQKRPAEPFPRKAILVAQGADERESQRNLARMVTSPEVAAYRVVNRAEVGTGLGDQLDIPTLLEVLRDQAAAVNKGDLSRAEAMLMNQATALQTLFSSLSNKALGAGHLSQFEAYMRMALRAQSQCARTLEVLAAMKNPPVVFARQANVTTGPQQNNFGISRGESEIRKTQQSEARDELLPDARASIDEGPDDQTLEALGEVDRAKVGRG